MSIVVHTPNITSADMSQLTLALQYIKQSPNFSMFYQNLDGLTFHVGPNVATIALPQSGQLMWNPTQGLQVVSDTGILGVQSPAMGLVHEIAHLIFGHNEAQATAFETRVAHDLGEPVRANYNATGSDVRVRNSTQHTDNGHWTTFEKVGGMKTGGLYDGSSNAPIMGNGYPAPPPNAPIGWGFASPWYSQDSKGDLHDASYWKVPDQQRSVPNNFDTNILEFHSAQKDSAPVAAPPIEHNDAHPVTVQIVGVHESAHY